MDLLTLQLAKKYTDTQLTSGIAGTVSEAVSEAVSELNLTAEVDAQDITDALTISNTGTTITSPFSNSALGSCVVTNTLTKSGTGTADSPSTYSSIPSKVTLNEVNYDIPVNIYGFGDVHDEFDIVTGTFTSKIYKMIPNDLSGKQMQYRNRSTTEGNKWMAVRFMNAVSNDDTLTDCNIATIAWLSGANQTEVQSDKNLSISFDYSKADTALANTEFSDVFKDEVVSQLASSNFDGTWSGHTGLIPNTEITRGKMFRAIITYLNLVGAEWYFTRTTSVTTQYQKTLMPLEKGDNTISVDAGNLQASFDVTNVQIIKDTVNLKEFGAVSNDNTAGSANYKCLINAVRSNKKVIIDNTYYITVDSADNIVSNVKLDGLGQGKLLITTATGFVKVFALESGCTGIVDVENLTIDIYSTTNYNVPTLIGVADSSSTLLNMQYVLFNNLHFKKPCTMFDLSTSADEATSINYLVVTNCRYNQAHYQYYKANTFHTRSNVGVAYPTMKLYGTGYKRAIIKDNYFRNCFFIMDDNDNDEWANYQKEEMVFANNTLINDDFYIPEAGYINMYTGMLLTRCNNLKFIDNHMEGLAVRLDSAANYIDDTSTLFATYMAVAYCRDVLYEGNVYKNNCNFSTNNQLIKCKLTRTGYDDITSTKVYQNNSFVVESDWLKKTINYATDYGTSDTAKLAKITSLGWSFASNYSVENYDSSNDFYDFYFSMSNLPIDYMAKSVVVRNNNFRIEYLFDTTNFCHAKSTIIDSNKIEAECLIGTLAKITKISGYSTLTIANDATSHSVHLCDYDTVEVTNNTIIEIPAKNSLLTKCAIYSTSTDSTATQNDKFNEIFILCAGFSQQNDLSCESVVIKDNLIRAHRFEYLLAYMNELGHNYNVLNNILVDSNTVLADNLLSFTPAESYLVYSSNSIAKTRKGVFIVYGKGICDTPTSLLVSNNSIVDTRAGTEYSSASLASALEDVTNKVLVNNHFNSTAVSLD